MARSYGLSGWALYRDVILPGALPSIPVGVLLYALLRKAADLAARGLERRFLRWNPAYR